VLFGQSLQHRQKYGCISFIRQARSLADVVKDSQLIVKACESIILLFICINLSHRGNLLIC
jgi:hypothetical protein